MDTFYKGTSGDNWGTICQIKAAFMHKNVSKNVMHCFNHCKDFMRFTTEGYTVLLALKLLQLNNLNSFESRSPFLGTSEQKKEYLRALSRAVVAEVWHQVPMSDVASVLSAETAGEWFCWCHEGIHKI